MMIRFKATGNAPDLYEFSGDTITVHKGDQSEDFDLSELKKGDRFEGVEPEELNMRPFHIIRKARRDDDGKLHVELCQKVIGSQIKGLKAHWRGSEEEIDSDDYDPEECYVIPTGASDLTEDEDYKIVWSDKNPEGWTIREVNNG